jgi:hypothetical protein
MPGYSLLEATYMIYTQYPSYEISSISLYLFGHLWVLVIRLIGVVLAVITIIRFYTRMKTLMKIRRGAIKLFSFKGFVFLHFAQAVSGKIALA